MSSPPTTRLILTAPRHSLKSPTGVFQPPPLLCSGPAETSHTCLSLTATPLIPAAFFSRPQNTVLTLDEQNNQIEQQILDQIDERDRAGREQKRQRVAEWVCGLPDFESLASLPRSRGDGYASCSSRSSFSSSSCSSSSSTTVPSSTAPTSEAPESEGSSGSWDIFSSPQTEWEGYEYNVPESDVEEEMLLTSKTKTRVVRRVRECYRPLGLRSVPLAPPRSRAGRGS